MKNDSISKIVSRRALLQGIAMGAVAGTLTPALAGPSISPPSISPPSMGISPPGAAATTLTFKEISHGIDQRDRAPDGYSVQVLMRWGDKLFKDAPEFEVGGQTAAGQEKHFGYNCDFTAFMPLPIFSDKSDHGLLVVNHEYTIPDLMFPDDTAKRARMKKQELDEYEANKMAVTMAAHGMTVLEIKRNGRNWEPVLDSKYNRRITSQTKMKLTGAASGHARMKTSMNPAGDEVWGTIANCSGCVTPWGTVLSAEENIHHYFAGKPHPGEEKNYNRLELGSASNKHGWEKFHSRFHMEREPLEPNRFGWIVELDPYDPSSKPVKHTALGRFRHQGASVIVNPKDSRVVVYMGDNGLFEYIYRFVSKEPLNYKDRSKNMTLLDEGTLYTAKFNDDGTLTWLPLVHGQGKLTPENGFASQADVLIDTRRAAQLMGATPMDKPEDVRVNPVSGRIFALLSSNPGRSFQDKNAANPRTYNTAGHIIEIAALTGNHTDEVFGWDFFILAGDPMGRNTKAMYGNGVSRNGWFSCPDNCAFDSKGRIWITTDQGVLQRSLQIGDGLYASDTKGPAAAVTKLFYRAPIGAELCGPSFTPDNKTLFVSVQHPGEGADVKGPSTRWPDFNDKMPPRPSVVAITKDDGGDIGS